MDKLVCEKIKKWQENPNLDESIKNEMLEALSPLQAFFYAPLSFGTAGLRGIMRPGINGMNVHTVMHATQGLASVIKEENASERGVAVSYDSRNHSREFA